MSNKNFYLIFGILWTAITAFITITFIVASRIIQADLNAASEYPSDVNAVLIPVLGFLSIFWIIGIIMVIVGIKKEKRDKKTEQYGEECYGKIMNVYPSGTYVNNRPLFKADFKIYIPSERVVRTISEEVGFNPVDYPINGYVKIKYYDNDINVESVISKNFVPTTIFEMLDSNVQVFEKNIKYENNNPIKRNDK